MPVNYHTNEAFGLAVDADRQLTRYEMLRIEIQATGLLLRLQRNSYYRL